jgi:hypothetical protein
MVGECSRNGATRNAYKRLVVKREEKRRLRRHIRRSEDNIKMSQSNRVIWCGLGSGQ